jgi:hypothetical protein
VLLHTLDEGFRPLPPDDNPHRNKPASVKKLKKSDGCWGTHKVILGWMLDTMLMTIELPMYRQLHLRKILASIEPNQKWITVKKWQKRQKLIGELRFMAITILGAQGLFSLLQEAFQHNSREVPDTLQDARPGYMELYSNWNQNYRELATPVPLIWAASGSP